jgi:hypothetical protein
VCKDGAWLFPAGDSKAMSKLMHKVLTDSVAVAQLVAKGREVEAGYSWARCAELTVESYRLALAEAEKPANARKRPQLPKEAVEAILVQARSPFSAERELAAWQERCLSVENTLRELRARIEQLQNAPSATQPAQPAPAPVAPPSLPLAPMNAQEQAPRPRFSLKRRIEKIRAGLAKWSSGR